MSDLTELLDRLPVPDHGEDFWANVERGLADRAGAPPEPIDPRDGSPLTIHANHTDVIDMAHRRRTRRWFLAGLAATAAVILLVIIGTGALSQDSAPGPVVTDPNPPTTTTPPSTTSAVITPEPDSEVDGAPEGEIALAPRSAGRPLSVSQSSDIGEGGAITVTGSGFPAGAQVGVAQCYGPMDIETNTTPDLGLCDLSNYVVTPTESGSFSVEFPPRRFIATGDGVVDCANPEPPNACLIAAADIANLSDLGILELDFDPAAAGAAVPVLTVSPADGLRHNQLVTVAGAGFQPGELVHLSTCPLNPGFEPCITGRGATKVRADAAGGFVTEFPVERFVESMRCDPDPNFDCQVAAVATRNPNPVSIRFAEDPSGSTPWITPTGPFEHGEVVGFEAPLMHATPGETFEARLCMNTSPLAVEAESCGEPVRGTVGEPGIVFDLEVQAYVAEPFTDPDGGTRFRYLTCESDFMPGLGTCHIRLETPGYLFPRYSINFVEGAAEAGRAEVNDR